MWSVYYFFVLFSVFLRNSLTSPVPGTRQTSEVGHENNLEQNNNTDVEKANRFWDDYWADWVNIGVAHENDTIYEYGPQSREAETRFLSLLHRAYRTDKRRCRDKHGRDCKTWAKRGYCTHVKSSYRSWMSENCPGSCNLCTHLGTGEENTCTNKRESCDLLFRFCTGPFEEHMAQWCPRTCDLCSTPPSQTIQQETNTKDRKEITNFSPAPPVTRAPSQGNCYPTMCGVVPALKRRRGGKRKKRTTLKRSRVNLRIVGGSRSAKGKWPWHGMLVQQVNGHARFCGITIICNYWVVTAAHCVVSPQQGFTFTRQLMKTFTLYVGRHQGLFAFTDESTQSFTEKNFDRFVVHPDFRLSPSFSHDIALIKLKWNSPIQFNRLVQPICLPLLNDLSHGNVLTTYGWGSTMGYGPTARYLKDVRLPFVDKEICRRKIWGLETTGTICAGGIGFKDTCSGDSGGSLVMSKPSNDSYGKRFFFYGITSYGTNYCNSETPYKPGVYTDVAYYRTWIEQETNGCCSEPLPGATPSDESSINSVNGNSANSDVATNNTTSSQLYRRQNFVGS